MPRYVAFLRGVSPMNARMPDLIRAFEAAGFTRVKTVISSGNVVFDHPGAPVDELERIAEQAMTDTLAKAFATTVRPVEHLGRIVDADHHAAFHPPAAAKQLITFLKRPHEGQVVLPFESDGAAICKLEGVEVYSHYLPNETGPLFMTMLEKTFGKQITTRTVDTVRKCIKA
ncbi:DUF1697 domain-containing protein [Roseateles chitinivorans]|uniref:DUF1697 domain-containing protein n=1 Tax=Roseateles chitinivorans TaxID=2917965 RepID=UPI003D676FA1